MSCVSRHGRLFFPGLSYTAGDDIIVSILHSLFSIFYFVFLVSFAVPYGGWLKLYYELYCTVEYEVQNYIR